MPRRYLITLLLLVGIPLVLVAWLGFRLARDEQNRVREQFRSVLSDKLRETDQILVRYFAQRQSELSERAELETFEADRLRELIRSEPIIRQVFVLESDGKIRFPAIGSGLNRSESEFLIRAESALIDKDLVRAAAHSSGSASPESYAAPRAEPQGWYAWYFGRGLHLIFWRQLDAGQIVGIELDRSRWMADLVAELPDTASIVAEPAQAARVRLVDAADQTIYQWGDYEPSDEAVPVAEIALSPPLASWRLRHYVDDRNLAGAMQRGLYAPLLAGLLATAVAVVGLGIYLYRESSRELREAATRVNFVNQVSHELRTPLTNIRLYAELLGGDLERTLDPAAGQQPRERLDVIVAESQRLSRLIGNVLTFARQQRQPQAARRREVVLDELVRAVLRHFGPAMTHKGIEVAFESNGATSVWLDEDMVEQILVNLVSNVEKYAADGRYLGIRTEHRGHKVSVWVTDRGPGVSPQDRETIFAPFHRLSDKLEAPTGVGIGLSIARGLARQHGGDVTLETSAQGAVFRIDLDVSPPTPSSAQRGKEAQSP